MAFPSYYHQGDSMNASAPVPRSGSVWGRTPLGFHANPSAADRQLWSNSAPYPHWQTRSIVQVGAPPRQSFCSPGLFSAGGSNHTGSHQLPVGLAYNDLSRTPGLNTNHGSLANVPFQQILRNPSPRDSLQHVGQSDPHVPEGILHVGQINGSFGSAENTIGINTFVPTMEMSYGEQETRSFGQVQSTMPIHAPQPSYGYLQNHPQVFSHTSTHVGPPPLNISPLPSSSHPNQLTLPQPHQENRTVLLYDETRNSLGRLAQYVVYPCKWMSGDGLICNMHVTSDRNSIFRHLEARHGVIHDEKILCRWGGLCPNTLKQMNSDSIARHIEAHLGVRWMCSSCDYTASRPETVKKHADKNKISCSGGSIKEIHGSGALFVDMSIYTKGRPK
ncbi:hypothetical protein BJ138DRAFT_1178259 [Hygrophoropsis aurantiaca]|uniref:Uncharacterized protein n=1 Tax=Hygrophoropsis aurantiaca TaxID=72124 RepID=A0ACB8AIX7_9AGAM|nr:hypothetical protein BJ138DRAFT_1178259 [Hygrophoropsis aurantiaca]